MVHTRFAGLVDYLTEGRIFGTYISDNYEGKKIGILAQNDDYGKEGEKGIKQGLEEQGANIDVVTEYYDEIQTDMTAHVQRLRNDNVDLLVFWGSPVQAGSMFKVARETLNWDVQIMVNSASAIDVVATLGGYDNVEGSDHRHFRPPGLGDGHPLRRVAEADLAEYAPDLRWESTVYGGMIVSVGAVLTLKQAGPDLTVDSFVAAAESVCKWQCATCLLPASSSSTDHSGGQAEVMARWEIDRSTDPPTPKWMAFGDPISFESTKDCKQPTPPAGYEDQPGPSAYASRRRNREEGQFIGHNPSKQVLAGSSPVSRSTIEQQRDGRPGAAVRLVHQGVPRPKVRMPPVRSDSSGTKPRCCQMGTWRILSACR